jgi:hypothetical protein
VNIVRLNSALNDGNIEWEIHVLERMVVRNIARDAVIGVLKSGDCIEDYPDDFPFPSALFFGWNGARPLHVVAALNEAVPKVFVVTTYEPDLDHFEPDFRTRRKR